MVKDLSGQQFGYLTVQSFSHKHNSNTIWNCICKCGNLHQTVNSRLVNGRVTSCGCKRKEHTALLGAQRRNNKSPLDAGWAYFKSTYAHNKNAKRLGFSLTTQQFQSLCSSNCHYCNSPPSMKVNGAYTSAMRSNSITVDHEFYKQSVIVVNGIDRIDSTLGYTALNTVTCCTTCNYAKSDTPYDQFLSWVSKVYQHKIRGG